MELSKIQYIGGKEKFILNLLQDDDLSVKEISTKHKGWLPENLYKSINKLKSLELVYQDDQKLSLSPEAIEILTYLRLVGELDV